MASTGDVTLWSCDKKDLHKKWSTVYILTKTSPDLHDALSSNLQTGLSSGTKFLNIGKQSW